MATQLTPHFSLEELTHSSEADDRKISNAPLPEHMPHLQIAAEGMEKVRHILGDIPIHVTSGYRNPTVNKIVGGVPNSAHALGYAVDFNSNDKIAPRLMAVKIIDAKLKFDQLIHETSRGIMHISFDPRMRGQIMTQRGGPGTAFETGI